MNGHESNGYLPADSIKEMIRDNSMLLLTLGRFGIPFGFGDTSVGKVCAEYGVDTDTFLTVCNLLSKHPFDPNAISLPALMDYLTCAHASFLDVSLPHIRHHLIEAVSMTGADDVTMLLIRLFDNYVAEVRRHMELENNEIFGYVSRLLRGEIDPDFNIAQYSVGHTHTAGILDELKDIFIYHFDRGVNARLNAILFDIVTCGNDMMAHFQVESRLFIPAVERLEKQVREAVSPVGPEENIPVETVPTPDALSEREKDIIRCVARGMSNKEIAAALFISTHTVATHRRNISAKLGVHSTAALALFAVIHNLIDINSITV